MRYLNLDVGIHYAEEDLAHQTMLISWATWMSWQMS